MSDYSPESSVLSNSSEPRDTLSKAQVAQAIEKKIWLEPENHKSRMHGEYPGRYLTKLHNNQLKEIMDELGLSGEKT